VCCLTGRFGCCFVATMSMWMDRLYVFEYVRCR
jgi:hypothetical protein